MKALRFNRGKLRWDLVDWNSVGEMVKVLEFGAVHYAPENWKKGLNREEILESAQRHLIALFNKETLDSKSKLHHAGHAMCNMMFFLYHDKNKSFSKKRANPFTSKTIKQNKNK